MQPAYPMITAETSNGSVDITENESHMHLTLRGRINDNISLHLHTTNNRPFYTSINVIIDECPPGFYYPSSESNEAVCECSTNTPHCLYGIIDCNNRKLRAHLSPQVWAGHVQFKGDEMLMTSDCPMDYCINTRVKLPKSSHTALDSLVCSHNRTGNVCGKCQNGYYVFVNCPSYHCGSCDDTLSQHGYLIIIISKYLPLTLMMCLSFSLILVL